MSSRRTATVTETPSKTETVAALCSYAAALIVPVVGLFIVL